MNADEVLIEDHNQLRGILSQLKATTAEDADRRRDLIDRLTEVLTVHVQIEDELFDPAIAEVSTLLGASHAQHRQIEDQLAVVCAPTRRPTTSPPNSTCWRRPSTTMQARRKS